MRPLRPPTAATSLAVHSARRPAQAGGGGRVRFVSRQAVRLEGRPLAPPRGQLPAAAGTAAQLPLSALQLEEPGEVDMLVHSSQRELAHRAENVAHQAQRLEHRLQQRLAALPEGARRLLAGGLAGAAGKTCTAPLSTVQMQLIGSSSTTVAQAVAAVWRRAGLRGFFRGNTTDVVRSIPSRGIELACYDYLKRTFRRWNRRHSGELHVPDNLVAGLAGGLAGVIASAAVYPLETVRTRKIIGGMQGNFVTVMGTIAREEGVPALYKGLDASLVGVVPYAALRLGLYDALRHIWRRSTGRKDIDPQAALLFGAVAGVASATATYPLEVIRRRLMAGAAHPHFVAAAASIIKAEGAAALFGGLLLALVKQAPATAVTFSSYEMAKQFLQL